MTRNLLASLLFMVFVFMLGVSAQPELDATFAGGGKTTIVFGATASADDLAIQPDNKIVLVSSCFHISLGSFPFCAIRLNADGSIDDTFRTFPTSSGVYTAFGTDVTGVALQSAGKIVAVGYSGTSSGNVAMLRYNTDGSLDSSFGSGGTVITDINSGSDDRARKVLIQPDGKILVVGTTANTQFVARYLSTGLLDGTFGTGGVAKTVIAGSSTSGVSIALQPDGKILAGGGTSTSFLLTRLTSDGMPDSTWDGDGIVTIGSAGSFEDQGFRSVAVQRDGRVVAVGHTNILYRFNANGSPDTSFDQDGSRQALGNPSASPRDVVVGAGGRITVVGEKNLVAGVPFLYLTARYLPDGSPDPSYSDDGLLDIDVMSGGSDGAWTTGIDSLGRVVIAGRSANGTVQNPFETAVFSVARLSAPSVVVSVSGRVTGPDGSPVSNALLRTQDAAGNYLTSRSSPFGYYRFDLPIGHAYTISVTSKRFTFANRVVSVGDEITDFDFVGASFDGVTSK